MYLFRYLVIERIAVHTVQRVCDLEPDICKTKRNDSFHRILHRRYYLIGQMIPLFFDEGDSSSYKFFFIFKMFVRSRAAGSAGYGNDCRPFGRNLGYHPENDRGGRSLYLIGPGRWHP